MALQRPKAVSCLWNQTLKNGVNILNIRCRQKAAAVFVGFSLLSANERETKNHLICRWKTRKEL